VATHAFNYGTAVFGGLRGYWNEEKKKLFVFRPLDHYRRFSKFMPDHVRRASPVRATATISFAVPRAGT